MRRDRLRRLLVLASVGACAACLPRGEPPSGRQVIADRTAVLAGVAPAASDGVPRLLMMRMHDDGITGDLFVVAIAEGGAVPTESLLAQNLAWGLGCDVVTCLVSDPRGRLFVQHDYDPTTQVVSLTRIDPVSGARLELGRSIYSSYLFSASGDRLIVPNHPEQSITLYEADDRATVVEDANDGLFIGEDFYYATTGQALMRLAPNGTPALVRERVATYTTQETVAGPVLVVFLNTDDPTVGATSFVDPATGQDLFPPVDPRQQYRISPDRRWLLALDTISGRYTLMDGAGATEEVSLPFLVANDGRATAEWRPRHSEVWFRYFSTDETTGRTSVHAWRKSPGQPPLEIPSALAASGSDESFFTDDGAYFFSYRISKVTDMIGAVTIQVGDGDDPAGPRFDIVPEGSSLAGFSRLGDGRFVTAGSFHSSDRAEIRAVDPATGASQTLATEGRVVMVGQRRLLALGHVVEGKGDLLSIDTDSGRSRLLAAEFALNGFAERQGADPDLVKPGAHLAYQFQARYASPYDGIWVTTIP